MADYNHRRAASELVTYRNPAGQVDRRPGSSGPAFMNSTMGGRYQEHFASPAFAGGFSMTETNGTCSFDGNKYANTNFHFRTQSYESPYSWDSFMGGEPASAPPTRRRQYGSLATAEARPHHMQLAPSIMQRRGSESSTSSALSNCTATAEGTSAWSASTTPETMSPTSPNNSLLLHSPPERTSSKVGLVAMVPPASPSKSTNQALIPCRPPRARAFSHSAPKRFQNTLIESPVPEEEEQFEACSNSKTHPKRVSHEASTVDGATMSANGLLQEDVNTVSNLRQRRQQRQQKIAGKTRPKLPVRLRLSPLPHLPLDPQAARASYTPLPKTLKTSRSSPQLRDAAGPPPTGPLPPLPDVSDLSLFALPTPRTPAVPPTPSSASTYARPPHPTVPPPPPPPPPLDFPGITISLRKSRLMTGQQPKREEPQPQDQSTLWEEELHRHKKLLEQFPPESEERHEPPKLSRMHHSLGNIHVRSRSLSRVTGGSSHDNTAIAESRLSHHASSFSLRGSKTQRPSTAKSSRDSESRTGRPIHPLPHINTPHVSVFEDDSDEEGDTVRRFVRNLFTRRTRSDDVLVGSQHASKQSREVSSGSKHSVVSAKSVERKGHNDRKKNHSASSTFSVATTIGASTVASWTTTPAPANADGCNDGCEVYHHFEGGNPPSPRTSSEHSRQHQKGPLLSRMFVRRSH